MQWAILVVTVALPRAGLGVETGLCVDLDLKVVPLGRADELEVETLHHPGASPLTSVSLCRCVPTTP